MDSTNLIRQNLAFLDQGLRLVERVPRESFSDVDPKSGRVRGFGPHLRHVLEHYSCFLAGLDSGRVDYESREREEILETDPRAAAGRIREIERGLAELAIGAGDQALEVRVDCGDADDEQWSRSTAKRELQFLASHTVHHYALIAMVLAARGVEVGGDFGVAPSTIRHWRAQEASCAPLPG